MLKHPFFRVHDLSDGFDHVFEGSALPRFGPSISWLLVSDLQVARPWAAGGSVFLFMYTLVFVFVYPVGVPWCHGGLSGDRQRLVFDE